MICYDARALQTLQYHASTSISKGEKVFGEMNYRDKTDTSSTILEVANGGTSKSKIISIAFLNHSSSFNILGCFLRIIC